MVCTAVMLCVALLCLRRRSAGCVVRWYTGGHNHRASGCVPSASVLGAMLSAALFASTDVRVGGGRRRGRAAQRRQRVRGRWRVDPPRMAWRRAPWARPGVRGRESGVFGFFLFARRVAGAPWLRRCSLARSAAIALNCAVCDGVFRCGVAEARGAELPTSPARCLHFFPLVVLPLRRSVCCGVNVHVTSGRAACSA